MFKALSMKKMRMTGVLKDKIKMLDSMTLISFMDQKLKLQFLSIQLNGKVDLMIYLI
jgi:hypothetical protein